MLCSMHPRTRLALLAARAHCRLLRNLPSTQTPADCFGGNNCTESSSNCLGNHSYNSYHTYVKHLAWIYTRMSSQMLLKVPQNPRYQRKLGLALPSYFYTHELSNICTNIKAEGGGGGWGEERLHLPGGTDLTLKVLMSDLQESMRRATYWKHFHPRKAKKIQHSTGVSAASRG